MYLRIVQISRVLAFRLKKLYQACMQLNRLVKYSVDAWFIFIQIGIMRRMVTNGCIYAYEKSLQYLWNLNLHKITLTQASLYKIFLRESTSVYKSVFMHRVRKKLDQQWFVHDFDKFKCIAMTFGKQPESQTNNNDCRHQKCCYTSPCKVKWSLSFYTATSERTKCKKTTAVAFMLVRFRSSW